METCIRKILETIDSPLRRPDGSLVTKPEDWPEQRAYIKEMLQEHVYGPMPEMPDHMEILSSTEERPAYGGKALESVYLLTADKTWPDFRCGLHILRPDTDKPVPVLFMVLGGSSAEDYVYPLAEEILDHGYAVAMVDREQAVADIPDADIQINAPEKLSHDEYFYYQIYKVRKQSFPSKDLPIRDFMAGYPYAGSFGKIAIGAHCVRLAVSMVLSLGFADPDGIAVTGHSRDGKVSLCAGVFDERIKAVIPQGSGCGGTALYKVPAKGLETIDDMVRMWPSWLPALAKYRGHHEDDMPIDMHFARAAVAPRAVMDTEGYSDFWAGPFSSYVGRHASQPAFDLLGVPERNGIFLRPGFHEMSREDILHTLMFCDYVFYGKKPSYDFSGALFFKDKI